MRALLQRAHAALGLTRAQGYVLAGTTLAAALLGFLPLFGGPGYESALALGLLLPMPLAAATALGPLRRAGPSPLSPLGALSNALCFALLVLALQLGVLLLHGARAGFCDAGEGLLLCLLGPALGALLAAVWGTAAGLLSAHLAAGGAARGPLRRPRALALTLAAAGPLGGILVSLWRFWSSPMIFAFDPFVGFFAGTLYDTVIDAVPRLITYRAGSAGTLLGALCAAALLRRSREGRLRWASVRRRAGALGLGLLGFGTSLGVYGWGPELGHYQTVATIRAALGQSWSSARCDIVYPSSIPRERVQLLGTECDSHIAEHEAYFELPFPGRITVFAFASAEQKGALMGASNTYIAKPWRHEVYVQNENYPHPVLSHELAHVVAGSFARGPFDVAGPFGGWIPDPGRIEGFAVAAAAPSVESDYTQLEWTRAMRDLGLLPPLGRLFRLSFLGQNSSTAYTVAGAVVAWLHDSYGPAALRAWYAGANLETAFGKSLSLLEQEFRVQLDGVVLPPSMLDLAKARFDRPAIFGRRCPHEVDELIEQAGGALERRDIEAASSAYAQSLRLDPANFGARLGLAVCEQRRGAARAAELRYTEIGADAALTRVQRATVEERLGDAALLAADLARAEQHYLAAEHDALDEGRVRTVAVKRYAARSEGQKAVAELLIGDPERGSDLMQSSAALGAWSASDPSLGLADYLIGKNLFSRQRWQEAALHLEQALGRSLPLPSVRREALRTAVFAACALGQRDRATARLREYLTDSALSAARQQGMREFAALCGLSP